MWVVLLVIVIIVAFLFKPNYKATIYHATKNAFLAKITYEYLTDETKDILCRNISRLLYENRYDKNIQELPERVFYSLMAMEMYGANINPALRGERWVYLPNPLAPILAANKEIDQVRLSIYRETGFDIPME